VKQGSAGRHKGATPGAAARTGRACAGYPQQREAHDHAFVRATLQQELQALQRLRSSRQRACYASHIDRAQRGTADAAKPCKSCWLHPCWQGHFGVSMWTASHASHAQHCMPWWLRCVPVRSAAALPSSRHTLYTQRHRSPWLYSLFSNTACVQGQQRLRAQANTGCPAINL
jgi:hypothetical protein